MMKQHALTRAIKGSSCGENMAPSRDPRGLWCLPVQDQLNFQCVAAFYEDTSI